MKTRLLTIMLALWVNIPIFSTNSRCVFRGNVGEFLSGIQDLLIGDTSDIIYRTELETLACDSLPHWIVKAPVQIQRFHANVVLLKKAPMVFPITEQSAFDEMALSFSDVNSEADLQELLNVFDSSLGPSHRSDTFPGVLCYKWHLEAVTLSLSWTARSSAYLFIIPNGIITS